MTYFTHDSGIFYPCPPKTPTLLGTVAHACNPSTLGGQVRQIMQLGDWDHPGQHGETLSLLKIQKQPGVVAVTCNNPSYLGGRSRRISWTQEVEVAVSWNCTTELQPGWQSKTLSQKKKRERERHLPNHHYNWNTKQFKSLLLPLCRLLLSGQTVISHGCFLVLSLMINLLPFNIVVFEAIWDSL